MRYIDTGSRHESQALGAWFGEILTEDVHELRWQSGYFFADGAAMLVPTFERLRREERPVRGVIGANVDSALKDDVQWLADVIGVPRRHASLGLVGFAGGLYHPKCYHIVRSDGSECAYVGSGNLTAPAVSGLNIEAALLLDTRDGDAPSVLRAIAESVDYWIDSAPPGFHLINGRDSIEKALELQLVVESVSWAGAVTDETGSAEGAEPREEGTEPRPRLRPLLRLPRARARLQRPSPRVRVEVLALPITSRTSYPDNFFFAPNPAAATSGATALSGSTLPRGAVGLVVTLNKDNARHFAGGAGTANMSIPLATVHTLRFGLLVQKYTRPRAEFKLFARYLGGGEQILCDALDSNAMAYGYEPDEPGHKDVRLLIPAAMRELGELVLDAGMAKPTIGDHALLEWPTLDRPDFRISYLEPESALAHTAKAIIGAAENAGELVGRGAAWLPPGLSPGW